MSLHPRHSATPVSGPRVSARRSRALVLVATMSLGSGLLTACGDSATPGSGSPQTVTVGVAGNIFDVPLRVADAQGYFRGQGLRVKFVKVTAATGTPKLTSGSLQFLNSSPTGFLAAIAEGVPEIAVGADGYGNPLGLVVSKKFAQQHELSSASSPEDVAKALAGSTAGSSSANTKAEAAMFLDYRGVHPSQVTWVSLPSPSADRTALADGRIDWFITSEPLPLQIQHAGEGVVVADSLSVSEWDNVHAGYGQVVVTRKSYAGRNGATVRKFVKAVQQGTAYVEKHVNDPSVVPAAKKALPGVPDSVVEASLKEVSWPLFVEMNQSDWKNTFDFVGELDALPEGADITTDDWTNTYVP